MFSTGLTANTRPPSDVFSPPPVFWVHLSTCLVRTENAPAPPISTPHPFPPFPPHNVASAFLRVRASLNSRQGVASPACGILGPNSAFPDLPHSSQLTRPLSFPSPFLAFFLPNQCSFLPFSSAPREFTRRRGHTFLQGRTVLRDFHGLEPFPCMCSPVSPKAELTR